MTTQDPELSAALGWPGGISDPVLDRTRLLQMVAALRLASQQALEALYQAREFTELYDTEHAAAVNERCHENIAALRAALAQQAEPVQVAERERVASQWDGCVTHQLDTFGPVDIGASIRAGELVEAQQDSACLHGVEDGACKECYATETDLSRCPQCNGPADNGFDRSFPPSPYLCTKCMAEPVQPGAWVASKDGRVIYDDASKDDSLLRVSGDFENDEQRFHYAKQIVDKLNATPPQRTMVPLTEEEIDAEWRELDGEVSTMFMRVLRKFARAVEQASWEKNHGQA